MIRLLVISALVIFAITENVMAGPLRPGTVPRDPQNGIVIVSVTQSPGGRSQAVFYMKEPHHPLRRLTPYIGEIFGRKDFSDPPGAVWALELTPGVYQIDRWGVMYNTGLGEGEFEPRDCAPLSFEIRSGEVVYLGNLHMETFAARNVFGLKVLGKGYPTFRDERQRDLQKFREKYPALANRKVNVRLLDFSPWKQYAALEETRR